MSRRMWVVALSGWVAVVIAGSALTWVAIDRAGRQVIEGPAAATTTQPPVVGTVGAPPAASPSDASSPDATRTALPASPGTATTSVPTRSSTPQRSGTSSPASKPSPSSAVRTETRTWTGSAGWVTVACTGSRAALKGASPNDGWSLERGDSEGDDVEVKFTSGENEVQVRATCVGGAPRFQAESGGADDH